MMGFLRRLFRVASANAHAAVDKIEDPIKLTEQGIRDLRKDLQTSVENLAQAKSVLINVRKQSEEKKELAGSYERKAIMLLNKAKAGQISAEEADRLATHALSKKQECLTHAGGMSKSLQSQEENTRKLQARVEELKQNIQKWENELATLKARSKVAQASKRLNKQLSQVDSSGTLALLEKMRGKVAEDEALADSYAELGTTSSSNVDAEIDKALLAEASTGSQKQAQDSLAELKAKLNRDASS